MNRLISLILLGMLAASGAAEAAERVFDLPFAGPGMTLRQLRTVRFPGGMQIFCGTDRELPTIDPQDRPALTVPPDVAKAGVDRCAVFAIDSNTKQFQIQGLRLAGNMAEFYVVIVVDDAGVQRVEEIALAQSNAYLNDTIEYFTKRFGPPLERKPQGAHWSNTINEAVVASGNEGNARIFLVDSALHELMMSRLRPPPKN